MKSGTTQHQQLKFQEKGGKKGLDRQAENEDITELLGGKKKGIIAKTDLM